MNTNLEQLHTAVLEIVCELSPAHPRQILPTDRLREDLGLDSVSSMELLSLLAERLDLDIPIEEAMEVTTVEGVLEMGRRHLARVEA